MNNTYDKLTRYCLYRERCTSEIIQKMYEWKVEVEYHEELIRLLKEEKFLDDERFIKAYINAKIYLKKWGKRKIEAELSMKKIKKESIRQAFQEVDDDIYIQNLDHLAERKWNSLSKKAARERQASLFRYLSGKGYESDLIVDWMKKQAPSK